MQLLRFAPFVALLAPLLVANTASADEIGEGVKHEYNDGSGERATTGIYFGASMGRGAMGITCDGCRPRPDLDEALSATAYVGMRLAPRVAIMGEYWLTRWHDRDGTWFDQPGAQTITQSLATGGVQLWVTRRLWFRAQAGYGRHTTTADYGERVPADEVIAAAAAGETAEPAMSRGASNALTTAVTAGFDIVHTPSFGLSAELRHGRTRADSKTRSIDVTALSLGLSWY